MKGDSGFDDKEFMASPYLKLIDDKEGGTCLCYQIRIHGKLHFVKKIRPEFEKDARMRAAFRKENEIGFSLSHPNLPRYVFLGGFLSPEEYVVTEWIEGQSLDLFLENNKNYFKNKDNLLRFIREISETLDYLHNNGVVHGDLKPSNIMLTVNSNNVRILDLGFAKTDSHILTGGFSPMYAAPEIINGSESQPASDYYSLGKILEFIETNTGQKLPSQIKRLKKDLLSEIKEQRPVGLTLVNRYFHSNRVIILLISCVFSLIFFSLFLYWTSEKEVTEKAQEKGLIVDQGGEMLASEEKDEDAENTTPVKIREKSIEEKANFHKEKDTTFKKAEYEDSLIKEVDRMINFYYSPILASIDSLYKIGNFSSESSKKISDRHLEATLTIFKSSHYENMFPEIPGERLVFLVNTHIKNYGDSVYYPIYMKYIQDVIDHYKIPSLD